MSFILKNLSFTMTITYIDLFKYCNKSKKLLLIFNSLATKVINKPMYVYENYGYQLSFLGQYKVYQ